jgi:hypothetical protein
MQPLKAAMLGIGPLLVLATRMALKAATQARWRKDQHPAVAKLRR